MPTSGIYGLVCDDKYYVGSSVDIEGRWRKHKSLLLNNKHYSKELQANYNAGMKVKYKILKRCPAKNLETIELEYIAKYNAVDNGYNLHNHYQGSVQTDESKQKISETKRLKNQRDILIYKEDKLVFVVGDKEGLKNIFPKANINKLSNGITVGPYTIRYAITK